MDVLVEIERNAAVGFLDIALRVPAWACFSVVIVVEVEEDPVVVVVVAVAVAVAVVVVVIVSAGGTGRVHENLAKKGYDV